MLAILSDDTAMFTDSFKSLPNATKSQLTFFTLLLIWKSWIRLGNICGNNNLVSQDQNQRKNSVKLGNQRWRKLF